MVLLQLFSVVSQQKLVQSATSAMPYPLASLVAADAIPIEFVALAPSGQSSPPWSVIPTAEYTLKIGLFDVTGTQLAYQNTWTEVANNKYQGVLNLNTAAVTALVNSLTPGQSVPVYLEIKVTDSNSNDLTALPGTLINLFASLITPASEVAQPVDEAATKSYVNNIFIKKDSPANEVRIRRTPSGKVFYETFDEDGQLHFEPADA